jgi:hypothetical protein
MAAVLLMKATIAVHKSILAMTAIASIAVMYHSTITYGSVTMSHAIHAESAAVMYHSIIKKHAAAMFHNTIVKHAAAMFHSTTTYKTASTAQNTAASVAAGMYHSTTISTHVLQLADLLAPQLADNMTINESSKQAGFSRLLSFYFSSKILNRLFLILSL